MKVYSAKSPTILSGNGLLCCFCFMAIQKPSKFRKRGASLWLFAKPPKPSKWLMDASSEWSKFQLLSRSICASFQLLVGICKFSSWILFWPNWKSSDIFFYTFWEINKWEQLFFLQFSHFHPLKNKIYSGPLKRRRFIMENFNEKLPCETPKV